MLNKYNKFIDELNEHITDNSGFDKTVFNISNDAKKSLDNIKYKIYSYYTNDKQEIIDGRSYWMVVRFEPTNINTKTQEIENKIFWCKFIISTPKVVKLNDMEINTYTYKFSGVDDTMNQYYDVLKSNIKNIKILKNKHISFAITINSALKQNQTNGFYLFSETKDILDVYSNKLFIRKNDYDGEIVSEKTVEKRQADKPRIPIYSVYYKDNDILILMNYKDGNPVFFNLTTLKTEITDRSNLNKNYKSISSGGKTLFDKYVENNLTNLNQITDINEIFNKEITYLNNVNSFLSILTDQSYIPIITLLLQKVATNLDNNFKKLFDDLESVSTDKQYKINILNELKTKLDSIKNIKDNIVNNIINNIKTKITNIK